MNDSYNRVVTQTRNYYVSPWLILCVILCHPASSLTSLHLNHRFGPTLMYLLTMQHPDDTAGVNYLLKGGPVHRLYDTNVIFFHCARFNPFLMVTSLAFIDSKIHRLTLSSMKHLHPHGHRSWAITSASLVALHQQATAQCQVTTQCPPKQGTQWGLPGTSIW